MNRIDRLALSKGILFTYTCTIYLYANLYIIDILKVLILTGNTRKHNLITTKSNSYNSLLTFINPVF